MDPNFHLDVIYGRPHGTRSHDQSITALKQLNVHHCIVVYCGTINWVTFFSPFFH